MTDDKDQSPNAGAETVEPDRVARAVIDILARSAKPAGRWDANQGVWVITYTYDSTRFQGKHAAACHVQPVTGARRTAVENALAEIAQAANIIFVRKDGMSDDVDIRIGESHALPFDGKGYTVGYTDTEVKNERRPMPLSEVVLDGNDRSPADFERGQRAYGVVVHELLHALKFEHPGARGGGGDAGGDNLSYSKRGTIMSYNYLSGRLPVLGLGPYDVGALQALYGKPSNQRQAQDRTLVADELPTASTLYANRSVTLDLTRGSMTGFLKIDTENPVLREQLQGLLTKVGKREQKDGQRVDARIWPGTLVNVLADDRTRISLDLTGRAGARLHGGAERDRLLARGGDNVLTGGKGMDAFVFDEKSGHGNVITDFTPLLAKQGEPDMIIVGNTLTSVDMRYTQQGGPEHNDRGTYLHFCKAGDGKPVASVFVMNATPDEIGQTLIHELDPDGKRPPEPTLHVTRARDSAEAQKPGESPKIQVAPADPPASGSSNHGLPGPHGRRPRR